MEPQRDAYDEPDAFVQMPPTHTRRIERLRYMTDPLPEDTLIAGPSVLYLYASIDQKDTNWIQRSSVLSLRRVRVNEKTLQPKGQISAVATKVT
jgi:hypothetical protein